MKTYDPSLAPQFDRLLCARERELCAMLDRLEAPAADTGVEDFKECAALETLATIDEAQAERLALELEQVLAARARLQDRSYGECIDCGDAIALQLIK